MKNFVFVFAVMASAFLLFPPALFSQQHDYLTEQEIELVRDAQDIDARIDVLTGAIDRRFAALKIGSISTKPAKEMDKWGPMPTGTRLELLDDVRKLLQKAIDDIDNSVDHPVVYEDDKNRSEKQKKKDSQRFPTAVNSLAAAAKNYVPIFNTLLEQTKDERERGLILDALDSCQQIIEAAGKLPSMTKTT
ncbi:MAG TPA: hypothetical protein VHL50_03520 [Pyrinomonadaceae bacterium]|nr:hypothetical protein [Pyrinomonadaceae bacterium]